MLPLPHKTIHAYLDFATIPSLVFLTQVVQNLDDDNIISIVGQARYNINEWWCQQYSDRLSFVKVDFNYYHNFVAELSRVLSLHVNQSSVFLNLHLNGAHAIEMLSSFDNFFNQDYFKCLAGVHLHAYDEGSEALRNLHKITQILEQFNDVNQVVTATFYNDKQELQKLFTKDRLVLSPLSRYALNAIFPTTYHLIDDKYLKSTPLLSGVLAEIGDYQRMDFGALQNLSPKHRQRLIEMLQIDVAVIDDIKARIANKKTFLFLGTTNFPETPEEVNWLFEQHMHLLLHYIHPNGDFYLSDEWVLLFKGHPYPGVNENLKSLFGQMISLPNNIPLEILMLLGIVPDKVGGFSSSAYLHFDDARIGEVYFMESKDEKDRASGFYLEDASGLKAMFAELGIVPAERCHYFADLPKFTNDRLVINTSSN